MTVLSLLHKIYLVLLQLFIIVFIIIVICDKPTDFRLAIKIFLLRLFMTNVFRSYNLLNFFSGTT